MRSVTILLITLGVLLSFAQAKLSTDVKRARFNRLNKKRALIGDILNFQGGDLISLFGSRYDLGSSYGQRNNNDYTINSHNNEMPSMDPDFPFDGFFDDKDFLDDPEVPGDGDIVDDGDRDFLDDDDRDFLDDPVFPGDDTDLPSDGEFIGGQAGINGNRINQLNNADDDEDDEDEDEDDEEEDDDEDNDCNESDLQDETT